MILVHGFSNCVMGLKMYAPGAHTGVHISEYSDTPLFNCRMFRREVPADMPLKEEQT